MRGLRMSNWVLNELRLEDITMYSDYLRKTQYPTNVFSWNFTYIWGESQRRRITWKIIDDMLVTFRHLKNGEIDLWCLPFGEGDLNKVVSVLYKSLKFCNHWNSRMFTFAVVRVINSPQLEFLSGSEDFNRLFKVKKLKSIERVHGINNLLTLAGKEFAGLRKKVNKFHRLYPDAEIRQYLPDDFNDLMQLRQAWNNAAGKKYKTIMDATTFTEVVRHYKELHHLILVVVTDDKITGMISGEISPAGYAWSYFIKAIPGINGIYEAMPVELAREIKKINPNIELLNVGSDMARQGLAEFKEKFRPVQRFARYSISINQ
jgi:hypothetical protein